VQKEIYLQCGGKLDGNYPGDPIWHTFCNLTGWRVKDQYISNSRVTYDTSAPPLHPQDISHREEMGGVCGL
jgi:hypothetical protein